MNIKRHKLRLRKKVIKYIPVILLLLILSIVTIINGSKALASEITAKPVEASTPKKDNSNGKKLFNGNEYNGLLVQDKNIIIYNDTNYYIYDNDLKKTLESKKYDSILNIHDNYVVVVDNKKLELLDLTENILATFDFEWQD